MFVVCQRKYFEIFASVGRPSVPQAHYAWKIDELIEDMKYARIHGCAFIHNAARDYSFEYGNRKALLFTQTNSRLFALAAVPETSFIETNNPNYLNELLENGVRAFVALNHSSIEPTLEPQAMCPIAEALIAHNRPLIISDVDSLELYMRIKKLAQAYPTLPIIMQGTSWAANRLFWNVMEQCENVHFEISSNHTNRILELTKKYFGIERAIYSSEWPIKSMGAMKSLIEYADISENDKDLVTHGNACRLFGINPASLSLYDENECQFDSIARQADEGLPLNIPIIDAHSHIGAEGAAVNNNIMVESSPDLIVKKMDKLGINTTITAPWIGICYDGTEGNEEVLTAVKKHPKRFLGFSTCNINYEADLDAVKKYHIAHPDTFVGIKPYPPKQNFHLTDNRCKAWFEFADKHHLVALIHADNPDYSQQINELAPLYPNITFILAHSGANYHIAQKNTEIARNHPNVILDITYTTTGRGMIEFLVSQAGSDKVIYGSDMPMRDPSPQLGWVCYARISEEDKKKILSENIIRILNKRII